MFPGLDIATTLLYTEIIIILGLKMKMQVSIREILSTTGISYWTFHSYRRNGLLPRPARHEKLKGRGSRSFYPGWIIQRINDIEAMRGRGLTLSEIKRGMDWTVEEKLSEIVRNTFEHGEGEVVTLFEHLTPGEVFKQISRQVQAGYSDYFVHNYQVKLEKKGRQLLWLTTMEVSKVDLDRVPGEDRTHRGQGEKDVHQK